MNNEDRIISLLTSMQASINTRLDKLDAGQTALSEIVDSVEAKVMKMEAGQVVMQADITNVKTELQDAKEILVVLENENKLAHGGLFDKIDDFQKKANEAIEQHEAIDEHLENHDLRLIRLENRAFSVRRSVGNN